MNFFEKRVGNHWVRAWYSRNAVANYRTPVGLGNQTKKLAIFLPPADGLPLVAFGDLLGGGFTVPSRMKHGMMNQLYSSRSGHRRIVNGPTSSGPNPKTNLKPKSCPKIPKS